MPSKQQIVPVIEMPTFPEPKASHLDKLIQGAAMWEGTADAIIVVGIVENLQAVANHYARMRRQAGKLPPMTPGIKPCPGGDIDAVKALDDIEGWMRLMRTIRAACVTCETPWAYMDAESLYKKHGDPTPIERWKPIWPMSYQHWIWYPSMDSYYEHFRAKQFEMLRGLARERLITVDRNFAKGAHIADGWRIYNRRVNAMHGMESWALAYEPEMIPEIAKLPYNAIMPYTGWKAWVDGSPQWVEALAK